ncbi:MAG: ornithine cyclodeaminase family protein [Clostridia bacterium]|nr:ornithine cyclodeaminase family protein [Clostridia bacterium]
METRTLILNGAEVAGLLSLEDAIDAVSRAYMAYNAGKAVMPPIVSMDIPPHNGEMDFKAGYSSEEEIISMKIAGGYWDNPKNFGLSSCVALICLFDGRNGLPLCVMDGTLITGFRTGAAGAVAARALARPDSRTAAILGTGGQARMQIRALATQFPLREVRVWGIEGCELYAAEMRTLLPGIRFTVCGDAQEAVSGSDIVVTATPSHEALVQADWISPGTHINAVGCDTPGKQELDPAIFLRAKVVNDCIKECVTRGETQHPIALGLLRPEDIHAEIGEILLGRKPGRASAEEITLYDTTGLSILDIHTAALVYRKACAQGVGVRIPIMG